LTLIARTNVDQPTIKTASVRHSKLADRQCEECRKVFSPRIATQVFCCRACLDAVKNRNAVRGKVIMPLAMAWRSGRGSKDKATTTRAFRELCAQLDRYAAEDAARGLTSPVKKLARQYRHEVRKE
jgi:ribosomal protein L37AE/L43A